MQLRILLISIALLAPVAGTASAEFAKIDTQDDFVRLVTNKELTRPFVNLSVTSDGRIMGMGASWEVTGEWTWRDGFFCRSLFWGGDDLGYNCQEVKSNGNRLRFTSDQGSGRSAVFRLK